MFSLAKVFIQHKKTYGNYLADLVLFWGAEFIPPGCIFSFYALRENADSPNRLVLFVSLRFQAVDLTFIVGIPPLTACYFSLLSQRKAARDVFYSCPAQPLLTHHLRHYIPVLAEVRENIHVFSC